MYSSPALGGVLILINLGIRRSHLHKQCELNTMKKSLATCDVIDRVSDRISPSSAGYRVCVVGNLFDSKNQNYYDHSIEDQRKNIAEWIPFSVFHRFSLNQEWSSFSEICVDQTSNTC